MLAYQTFEHTSLTDVSRKRNPLTRTLLSTWPMKRVREWAADPLTRQPWSHVLAEPLIQLGKNGPVLTVERHCMILASFASAAAMFEYRKQHKKALCAAGGGVVLWLPSAVSSGS